jgi:predicted dehydrogenase
MIHILDINYRSTITMQGLRLQKNLPHLLVPLLFFMNAQLLAGQTKTEPLKVGVAGLTHTHVHWILGRPDRGDIKIVGIVEPNRDLAQRYSDQHGFSMDIVFNTMEEMIAAKQPEAVTAFGTIYDHLKVVEICAPLGIHVMVEKPLAVSMEHARKMKALADKHHIHLLTNYETTWYATNHRAFEMVHRGDIGDLRKIVVHDGHKGPIELGINQEFLEWLTDPIANGGGALTDFGCYGANLITWLNDGKRPEAVMAMTQTIKPDLYPKVEDEATIVLQYPQMQAIIQASWNWPIARKDMEVYGRSGYVICDNRSDMRYRLGEDDEEHVLELEERPSPFDDPFALLAALVRNQITLPDFDLSSIENNMIVVEILDAAKKSAETGRLVKLK